MAHSLRIGLSAVVLVVLSAQPVFAYNPANREEYLAKIKEARAVFNDRCKKVAGVKIYKTVPDVEGLLLMKIRPVATDRELFDPMWPGAAFGGEYSGDSYIRSFLGYEHSAAADGSPVTPQHRGYINTDKRPRGLPGYRWVEVGPLDGQRFRYTGSVKPAGKKNPDAYKAELQADPNYDMNIYRWSLDKTPSPSKTPPRYGVTFEDHVIPEERALWLASGTIKVVDLKTDEVLAEWTRYAMSYIHRPGGGVPWLNHVVCPATPGMEGTKTRQFVDQVLIPRKSE